MRFLIFKTTDRATYGVLSFKFQVLMFKKFVINILWKKKTWKISNVYEEIKEKIKTFWKLHYVY